MNIAYALPATLLAGAIACTGMQAASGSPAATMSVNATMTSSTPKRVTCLDQLAAIRKVSGFQYLGIRPGSLYSQAISDHTPKQDAKVVRRANLPDLARAIAGIHDNKSDHDAVMATQATAVAIIEGRTDCPPNN
jgi:hypothetical protein